MNQNRLRQKEHVVPSLTITACAVLLAFGTPRMLHAQQNPTAARIRWSGRRGSCPAMLKTPDCWRPARPRWRPNFRSRTRGCRRYSW